MAFGHGALVAAADPDCSAAKKTRGLGAWPGPFGPLLGGAAGGDTFEG
jgi:hypothetical protein